MYGGGLAGMGTSVLIRESHAGFQDLARRTNTAFRTAWCAGESMPKPWFDFSLTASSNEERHMQAEFFADEMMQRLEIEGITDAVIYSFGYTSFMAYGFRKHIKEGRTVFVWGDCSPPDTDDMGTDLSSRFYGPAYEGTHGILYGWHEAMPAKRWIRMGILKDRIPENLASYHLTMLPFSQEYVRKLTGYRGYTREKARSLLTETSMFLPETLEENRMLAVLCSSDIWSGDAVDKWITPNQHWGVVKDTKGIFADLEKIGEALEERIGLFTHPAALQVRNSYDSGLKSLKIIPNILPRTEYRALLRAADLVITRASHSVTSAECAAMGIAQIIVPMPRYGYMNVHDFTADVRRRRLALVTAYRTEYSSSYSNLAHATFTSSETVPDLILTYLQHIRGHGEAAAERAMREFDRVNTTHNFFGRIERFLLS